MVESTVAYPYLVVDEVEVSREREWFNTKAEEIVAKPSPFIGDPSLADSGAYKDLVAAEQVALIDSVFINDVPIVAIFK